MIYQVFVVIELQEEKIQPLIGVLISVEIPTRTPHSFVAISRFPYALVKFVRLFVEESIICRGEKDPTVLRFKTNELIENEKYSFELDIFR